ncbi:MAG: cell division protein FtsA [Patescibacteria group bacterium]
MIRNIFISLDVGSYLTKIVVGEFLKGEKNPKILGIGESETRGIRRGYVTNFSDAVNSIKNAINIAEKNSNIKIKNAFVSINGISLRSEISVGSAIISKADGEITNLDINKAIDDSENNLNLNNKKIIQKFPISFRVDSKEILGKLEGVTGIKLEAKVLFITYSTQHLEELLDVISEAGIEILDIIPAPIAGSCIALSEKQKIVGSALVNIGSEITSLVVFENDLPIYVYSFPIGSADITHDIALGFKIPLEKAESLKLGNIIENYSQKKIDQIIEARISDIFELIENHLKKIKRNGLLPAGIVFIGGGSNVNGLEEYSKSVLNLPSRIGNLEIFSKTKLRDPAYLVSLGILNFYYENEKYQNISAPSIFKNIKNTLALGLKQLMP